MFYSELHIVISAETEKDADELAERIARDTEKAYRFRIDGGPDATVASASVEVTAPKRVFV